MAESESSGGVFDEARFLRIVELMKEHDLAEVDLRDAEQRICIKRGAAVPPMSGHMAPSFMPPAYMQPPAAPQVAAPAQTVAQPGPVDADDPNVIVIKSPMVGTFYSKPNPKAASYVKVGDHVEPETTICIIEAMKVFNEIPAEMSGKVVAILVGEEEPVEFGKPLFKIDTTG
ncbi:MAG: acetyl-CoA carboxylase biotin carboxyl carrier protein [Pirellulaceae bacterium]|jgi:acetyl-CoA carboxylase biotin carboxyl carrier protein|nr:acetyl-CoA carboxylase biotin carboxyl carrier protein [Pirellulaceae bacterium]MDP6553108.1 acetyl-CoA carboxylase biotin carboxyl carrier protein [Pirellulaceae bacterium]